MPRRAIFPGGSSGAAAARRPVEAAVERVDVSAYVVPTDAPESDGTFAWDATTIIVAEVHAAAATGLGYTYGDPAVATVLARTLGDRVVGLDAMDIPAAWAAMNGAVRNAGRPGIASAAISALDAALWDLKARLLDVSMTALLGSVRPAVDVYGSGGFTSYAVPALQQQLAEWVASGIRQVKMKVGRDAAADPARVRAARAAIGPDAGLFVDANGAWTPSEACAMAQRFEPCGVSWFEEPVTSDDLDGLRRVRDRAPAGMAVAAGEYGYDIGYFRRMVAAGAVDVLQADATRCGGITGFLQAGAICEAFATPLSAHTAPSLHAAVCCALPCVRHVEYFHDHARIERLLFDGAAVPRDGRLSPDPSRPGFGLELKRTDAVRYEV